MAAAHAVDIMTVRFVKSYVAMENTSLSSIVWDVATKLSVSGDVAHLFQIRDLVLKVKLSRSSNLVLKVIYIIVGTLGVIDNLFVLLIFFFFIKITEKVRLDTFISEMWVINIFTPQTLFGCSIFKYVA